MHSSFPVDDTILLGSVLVVVGVVVSGVADRFRFPGLLVFLLLGMAVADDGLALIHFDDAPARAERRGHCARRDPVRGRTGDRSGAVRRASVLAAVLATVGVVITAECCRPCRLGVRPACQHRAADRRRRRVDRHGGSVQRTPRGDDAGPRPRPAADGVRPQRPRGGNVDHRDGRGLAGASERR